jgi:hypothetical protein
VHMPAPPCSVILSPRPSDALVWRHAHGVCLPPDASP